MVCYYSDILLKHYPASCFQKIGKVYPLEYADIPKLFFTPSDVDHC
jgi:hypothetical protein